MTRSKDEVDNPDDGHGGEENDKEDDNEDVDDDNDDNEVEDDCHGCDMAQTVRRKPRDMKVHYGLVASGSQVIRDAQRRKSLVKEIGSDVLCVEMAAAGLMDNFPCIVIKGICDYADSHNNLAWKQHAAAVAAAAAKELLEYLTVEEVKAPGSGAAQGMQVDGEYTAARQSRGPSYGCLHV